MCGGENGERGLNYLMRSSSGRVVNIGGKNTVRVDAGDVLSIYTPGGGGFGSKLNKQELHDTTVSSKATTILAGGSLLQYSSIQESA